MTLIYTYWNSLLSTFFHELVDSIDTIWNISEKIKLAIFFSSEHLPPFANCLLFHPFPKWLKQISKATLNKN